MGLRCTEWRLGLGGAIEVVVKIFFRHSYINKAWLYAAAGTCHVH